MIPINSQPVEKRELRSDDSVVVHSIFYTIQGEGPHCGRPAVFVRLAGCNLQCPQCDTVYTGPQRLRMQPEQVLSEVHLVCQVSRHRRPLVVITGGEPFRQSIGRLVELLWATGHAVQIETNGTFPPPPGMPASVDVVVSPKTGKVHPLTEAMAMAYKYVLNASSYNPEDGLPLRALDHTAEPMLARPPKGMPRKDVYIQPADLQDATLNARNLRAVIKSCMMHGYTLQLQTHKLIGLE